MLKVVAEKRCRLESLWKSEKSLFHFVRIQKCANFASHNAAVAQLVEHQLPKLRVAGSSPVCRSVKNLRQSMLESAGVLFLCVGVLGVLCDGRWEALPVQSASQPTRGEKLLRFVLWNGE